MPTEVETYNDHLKLNICTDEFSESPREWNNLGTMVCWHRRYDLGDEQPTMAVDDWARSLVDADDETDIDEVWDEIRKRYIILPLYLYDHSGITMNTTGFSCPWDSGQVGYIYCEKGKEGLSDEKIKELLIGEVETYDQYLTGDVYGFVCYRKIKYKECDHVEEENVDSCWGFYGSDPKKNGMMEQLPDEFKALIE